jgi:hypothetical protein
MEKNETLATTTNLESRNYEERAQKHCVHCLKIMLAFVYSFQMLMNYFILVGLLSCKSNAVQPFYHSYCYIHIIQSSDSSTPVS